MEPSREKTACPPHVRPLFALAFLVMFAVYSCSDGQYQSYPPSVHDASRSYQGYTLFTPYKSDATYLIDNDGVTLHRWNHDEVGALGVYLLPTGQLLRSSDIDSGEDFDQGGRTGRLQLVSWDGDVEWQYEHYQQGQYILHHDMAYLPNGNILAIAWEARTGAEVLAAGRDPQTLEDGELWPDMVIEIDPVGADGASIVWEWRSWDHLVQDFDPNAANYGVIGEHPERIDVNFMRSGSADWLHTNGIAYNEDLDQIALSIHGFSEIWIVDHSTTTEEAASGSGGASGMGGDLLYRWGNPAAYGMGGEEDRKLFRQHDAHWIGPGLPGEGDMLVFNNGVDRSPVIYSSADQFTPPLTASLTYERAAGEPFGPEGLIWTYYDADDPEDFYASFISSADRLPNGNTLICEGPEGRIFEVAESGEVVWEYTNRYLGAEGQNWLFKARRYAPDYAGLGF